MGPAPTSDSGAIAAPAASADPGRTFVDALRRKDFGEIETLLDPGIDFRALTPGRAWEASDSRAVVADILPQWFEESDHIDDAVPVARDAVADRQHVAYRLRITNPEGRFLCEQQAYFTERDGRINWMRVLCSGFRPQ